MLEKEDIHRYEQRINGIEHYLRNVSARNKDIILSFKNYLFTQGLSKGRILKYVECLKKWSEVAASLQEVKNKDLDTLTKTDLQTMVSFIQQEPYSPWTKQTYRVILKKFVCWNKKAKPGKIPKEIEWLKLGFNKAELKLPGEGQLLTKEEIEKAINTCTTLRDKAFLSLLYESGCRIGELASLKIGNITFDTYGAQLVIMGKTGSRRIRIINTSFLLRSFLETHPLRDKNDGSLWVSQRSNRTFTPVKYGAIRTMVHNAFLNAGIKKRCNPHLFRHSRATEMASFLTEFQMNQ
ncbi:MAG: tyrosine-type recombinase/integrase, partial [Candidatus Nanoarchaeia archaeon]